MNELVSVVVPIYNSEKYLYKCIDSILKQTYRYIEVILINDGSIDRSLEICNSFQEKDNRVIIKKKLESSFTKTIQHSSDPSPTGRKPVLASQRQKKKKK